MQAQPRLQTTTTRTSIDAWRWLAWSAFGLAIAPPLLRLAAYADVAGWWCAWALAVAWLLRDRYRLLSARENASRRVSMHGLDLDRVRQRLNAQQRASASLVEENQSLVRADL